MIKGVKDWWYGGDKEPIQTPQQPTNHQANAINSITQLEKRAKTEQQKQKQLLHKCKKIDKQAKEAFKNGDKARAKTLLTQKRTIQKQIRAKDGVIHNLQHQIMVLDGTAGNVATASAMRDASVSMKTLVQESGDIDEIHQVMDDMIEAVQIGDELAQALGQPMGGYDSCEEDDIEDQLQEWEEEASLVKQFEELPVPIKNNNNNNNDKEDDKTREKDIVVNNI